MHQHQQKDQASCLHVIDDSGASSPTRKRRVHPSDSAPSDISDFVCWRWPTTASTCVAQSVGCLRAAATRLQEGSRY